MPSGLAALLDDIATITKMAAASVDDIGAAAAKAGTKAAGVVVDDAAVTPRYVTGFTPQRELPIIWAIAKGSLKNKLLILLPAAMLLTVFLPWAITPLLMVGGAFLCFEGAEKLIEAFGGEKHGDTIEDVVTDPEAFEKERVAGAVRTDFILSAEIMAIALDTVKDSSLIEQGITLAVVAIGITVLVYGAVGLIVKMDDIGLHLAERADKASQALGRGLLLAMPKVMAALSVIGIAAMLWVGGQIVLHGAGLMGLHGPEELVHSIGDGAGNLLPAASGIVTWVTEAALAGVFGVVLGALIAFVVHQIQKAHGTGH